MCPTVADRALSVLSGVAAALIPVGVAHGWLTGSDAQAAGAVVAAINVGWHGNHAARVGRGRATARRLARAQDQAIAQVTPPTAPRSAQAAVTAWLDTITPDPVITPTTTPTLAVVPTKGETND